MRAAVVHSTLNPGGGGELLSLAVIESLQELGFEVDLVTMEPTDWGRVWSLLGRRVKPDGERTVIPFRVKAFTIYARLLFSLRLAGGLEGYDLVVNTHGDMIVVPADIVYMHFPTFAIILQTLEGAKYARSPYWRIYFEPYRLAQTLLAGTLKRGRQLILTNSSFSRAVIRRVFGVNAVIVYPPVDIEAFARLGVDGGRGRVVYTTGRYSPDKNYELILEVARLLPDVEFHVVGSLSGATGRSYLERLETLKRRAGLGNVHFHVNTPRRELVEMYGRGMVYLHTMKYEHFGIAVVEGMAAGLVPVVHRSGGPWLDIVARGRYGLGYATPQEAVGAVEEAIRGYPRYSSIARARAREFTWERFKERFKAVATQVIRAKNPGAAG